MDELSELIKDETGERGLIECLCRVTDPGNLLGVTQLSFFLLFMQVRSFVQYRSIFLILSVCLALLTFCFISFLYYN